MQLDELTEKQILSFIANYEKAGEIKGGKFTLAQLQLEIRRRIVSPFPPADTARAIVEIAQSSKDGLVTYKQVWEKFRPNRPWIGNAPRTETGKALGRVIAYCVDNGLPILSSLVVQAAKRSHSDDAIMHIYTVAKSCGVDVGTDPEAFVRDQQDRSRQLVATSLPEQGAG